MSRATLLCLLSIAGLLTVAAFFCIVYPTYMQNASQYYLEMPALLPSSMWVPCGFAIGLAAFLGALAVVGLWIYYRVRLRPHAGVFHFPDTREIVLTRRRDGYLDIAFQGFLHKGLRFVVRVSASDLADVLQKQQTSSRPLYLNGVFVEGGHGTMSLLVTSANGKTALKWLYDRDSDRQILIDTVELCDILGVK